MCIFTIANSKMDTLGVYSHKLAVIVGAILNNRIDHDAEYNHHTQL